MYIDPDIAKLIYTSVLGFILGVIILAALKSD